MLGRDIRVDAIVFSSCISAHVRGEQWSLALDLLGQMRRCRVRADVIALSAGITAYGKGGHWQAAIDLLFSFGGHVDVATSCLVEQPFELCWWLDVIL